MGGAFGHMPHPFDLEKVKSGEDLINLFKDIQTQINNEDISQAFNIKIDGANLSFKLVGNQFAVDRGTQKKIDVEGITINRIHERYDPTFKTYKDIETLLIILNSAYNDILPELMKLGMTKDNSIFLNTEFVSATNVIDYDEDFIAIHGVCQFYEKFKKVKGGSYIKTRDGIPNPKSANKAISKEIDYDINVLLSLIEKLNFHAKKMGVKVFGPIPSRKLKDADISQVLKKRITIPAVVPTDFLKLNNGNTLFDWLKSIHHLPANYSVQNKRYDNFYPKKDGKKINPYHKATYLSVFKDKLPIDSIAERSSIDSLAAGMLILHATRLIGSEILKCITSEIGVASNHEGVVIRDNQYSEYAFKITGDYIVNGMFGAVAKDAASS